MTISEKLFGQICFWIYFIPLIAFGWVPFILGYFKTWNVNTAEKRGFILGLLTFIVPLIVTVCLKVFYHLPLTDEVLIIIK